VQAYARPVNYEKSFERGGFALALILKAHERGFKDA
jgi:hypothetical protein